MSIILPFPTFKDWATLRDPVPEKDQGEMGTVRVRSTLDRDGGTDSEDLTRETKETLVIQGRRTRGCGVGEDVRRDTVWKVPWVHGVRDHRRVGDRRTEEWVQSEGRYLGRRPNNGGDEESDETLRKEFSLPIPGQPTSHRPSHLPDVSLHTT